jgi:hypothetical protein
MAQEIHHEDTKITEATKLTVIFVHFVVIARFARDDSAKI